MLWYYLITTNVVIKIKSPATNAGKGETVMRNEVANVKVVFEDKKMVTEQGETIEYIDTVLEILGVPVHVSVKKQDKGLLTFLRSQLAEGSK